MFGKKNDTPGMNYVDMYGYGGTMTKYKGTWGGGISSLHAISPMRRKHDDEQPDARQGERLRLRFLSSAPIPINSKNHSNIPSAAASI